MIPIPSQILPFNGWTHFTPTIPEFYWNVYSSEERIKKICCELHKLCEYANMLGDNINIDHQLIEELQAAFKQFMESGFDDYYAEQIEAWVNANMESIITQAVKMVWFGLTEDGYFVAYIPDSWEEIIFDTGAVYSEDSYGCLMLKWESPNGGVVDDENLYKQTAIRLGRIERTLYTAISEGGE